MKKNMAFLEKKIIFSGTVIAFHLEIGLLKLFVRTVKPLFLL